MPAAFSKKTPLKKAPLRVYRDLEQALAPYIIRAALPGVLHMLHTHPVHVAFSDRKGRALGYYIQPREPQSMHTISLQIALNPYALLFVFLHEWAHLTTQLQYGDSASAHGKEWKANFRKVFAPFHSPDIFPPDILEVIDNYFVKTSRYFETELNEVCNRYGADRKAFERTYFRLLKKGVKIPAPYMGVKAEEIPNSGRALVRDLPEGALFRMEGKDYRLLAHAGGFATATSLSDASALRIHGLLSVEVLKAGPFHE